MVSHEACADSATTTHSVARRIFLITFILLLRRDTLPTIINDVLFFLLWCYNGNNKMLTNYHSKIILADIITNVGEDGQNRRKGFAPKTVD